MHEFTTSRARRLSIAVILLLTLFPLTVSAQGPGPQVEEATAFSAGLPTFEEFEWATEPPVLTEEQMARLEWGLENSHLSPRRAEVEVNKEIAGPVAGTESNVVEERDRPGYPLAPGDAAIFRNKGMTFVVPPGYGSNVMESSVGIAGRMGFYTGNWFAARTGNGGSGWVYVSPWSGYPNFCCDQIAIYDEARDIFLWLRMAVPTGTGNDFALTVFPKDPSLAGWTYYIPPTAINAAWVNYNWDYPHIQLGANYMYLAWNLFPPAGTPLSVMLRVNLDSLAAAGSFAGSYYAQSDWFTFVPVQGAYHRMYWASNWPWEGTIGDRLRIWRWDEDSGTIYAVTRDIPQFTPTFREDAHCPLSGPHNWAERYDQRVLTGARFSIYHDGFEDERIPGRKVVAWWWNVGEGGDFPLPYIEGAAFYEDTLTLLPGYIGRPYFWNPELCFAYPSISPNKRQDLGGVFNWAAGPEWTPKFAYTIADDYSLNWPPGWTIYGVRNSKALPADNKWGDYNTVREFEPTQKVWVAGGHFIGDTVPCTNCGRPVYIAFGRERDFESYNRWWRK
jgi:hypothetical protein